ncbi:MAG: hypothetical protein DRI71_00440 [Bacteroidetes bacterium]|nr:MAG: hypothetical protein DRI71_00440 [Bacteroidota bacterium]
MSLIYFRLPKTSSLEHQLVDAQKTLEKLEFQLSNSTDFINSSIEISSQLNKLLGNGDYENKIKLQNLVFPEGLYYEKKTNNYQTAKINPLFEIILTLSTEI